MAIAYQVTWWRCDEDGDLYWVTPRDGVRLVTLMTWHTQLGHREHPPCGRYRSWTVYANDEVLGRGHGTTKSWDPVGITRINDRTLLFPDRRGDPLPVD